MTTYTNYGSIVPSQMTQNELQRIIGELQTAINWGFKKITVGLSHGLQYNVDTKDIQDYREELGGINTGSMSNVGVGKVFARAY